MRIIMKKTEIIYGAENNVKKTMQAFSRCKKQVDNCIDSSVSAMFVVPNHPITNSFRELKRRGTD
jgi:hypothetical protein